MKKSRLLKEEERLELESFIENTDDIKEIKRCQAILMLNGGVETNLIEKVTGLKRTRIFVVRKKFITEGISSVINKRKPNKKRLLTKKQREEIINIIEKTKPKDYGYESDFWTTLILGDFIKERYEVQYKTRRPYYLLFEEAKFSFHKPGTVYEKRDQDKVDQWEKEITPILKAALKDENVVVFAEDEMILSSQTTTQKVWLKRNEYPFVKVSKTRINKSIYGFLNIKNGKCHAFLKEWQNMYITTEVLKEIRALYQNKKILLFWDNAKWHHGSKVQEFIEQDGNIQIIYFPTYSPDKNPQEHVWKTARVHITHNKFIPDIDLTTTQFVDYLHNNTFLYSLLSQRGSF